LHSEIQIFSIFSHKYIWKKEKDYSKRKKKEFSIIFRLYKNLSVLKSSLKSCIDDKKKSFLSFLLLIEGKRKFDYQKVVIKKIYIE
jgi:hypothetical protein